MERSEQAQDNVVVDTREAVGQDLEKKSGKKQSPSREKKNGYRGETVAKEEEVQGGEAGGADPPRGCSKEGEYPGRGCRTAEEGETSEETKKDEFHRPPLVDAPLGLSPPLPRSSGCRVSCGDGRQEECMDLPAKFESGRLKSSLVPLIKK